MNWGKAIAQVVATVIAAIIPAVVDGFTPVEIVNVVLIGLGAIGVGVVPNLTAGVAKYAKAIVSITTAVATLLVSYFADGSYHLTTSEWLQLLIAALGAVGVVAIAGPQWGGPPAQVRSVNSAR
jgi:hypothetical protein